VEGNFPWGKAGGAAAAFLGERRVVPFGTVFDTGPGELVRSHNVQWLVHVAAVWGELERGYGPAADISGCTRKALACAEQFTARSGGARSASCRCWRQAPPRATSVHSSPQCSMPPSTISKEQERTHQDDLRPCSHEGRAGDVPVGARSLRSAASGATGQAVGPASIWSGADGRGSRNGTEQTPEAV
jgi:hypothetical protein